MFSYRRLSVVAGVALLGASVLASPPQTDRTIYVSAVGGNGMPVMDLTAAEFAVTEDNTAREVVKIDKATEPVYYALLVDTSLGSDSGNANNLLPYLRESLAGFVKVVLTAAPDSKILFMSFGGAATVRQDFTSDLGVLEPLVSKVANVSGEPVVGEALQEASKLMAKVPSRRRAIVMINREPTGDGARVEGRLVAADMQKSGASLWAISVRYGTRQDAQRDELLKKLAPNTGGIRVTLGSPMQLADYLRSVAANTIVQYAVTIKRPADAPALTSKSMTSVKINRAGVTPLTLLWWDK
jgi:hypothetical protein